MFIDHPNPCERVPISLRLVIAVNYASMRTNKEKWQIVEEAVDAWLRKNEPGVVGEPAYAGYQWKSLFLPHGSVLRTMFNGKSYHCHVESDRIVYEGSELTPSGFVNAVGGVRRNAWKSIWVLLPEAKHWQRADTMRVRRHAPRSVAHASRPRPMPPAGAECVASARPLPPAPPDAPPVLPAPAPVEPSAPPAASAAPPSPAATPSAPPAAPPSPPATRSASPAAPPAPHFAPSASIPAVRRPVDAPPEPASSLAGWARKRRPRRSFAGSARRLLELLQRELLPLRNA